MGFGNLAEVRENQAIYRRQELRRLQVQALVVTQVVQSCQLAIGWRGRVNVSRVSLFDGQGRPTGPVFQSLRLNFDRIRNAPGTRALEVLDSIRGLNDLLEAYGQATTDYERARFRLLVTLGLPAQAILDSFAPPSQPECSRDAPAEASKSISSPSSPPPRASPAQTGLTSAH